eukprot:gene20716-33487_t
MADLPPQWSNLTAAHCANTRAVARALVRKGRGDGAREPRYIMIWGATRQRSPVEQLALDAAD